MTNKITGGAASHDDNANLSVARESVQRLGERVAHLLVEIDAPCAAQCNDRNSIGYSCRQNIGVHPVLLSQGDALRGSRSPYFARSCPRALSQFSRWKVRAILPSLIVWISIAMI